MGMGGAGAGSSIQMMGKGGSSRPGRLSEDLSSHYSGSGLQYFIAHLVNQDLTKARPFILEVSPFGIGFAHPKPPFEHFKTFTLDEIVGWKATDAEFSFVTLSVRMPALSALSLSALVATPLRCAAARHLWQEKKGKTQQWSVATEYGATIVRALDAASKSAFEQPGSDLSQVALVTGNEAV